MRLLIRHTDPLASSLQELQKAIDPHGGAENLALNFGPKSAYEEYADRKKAANEPTLDQWRGKWGVHRGPDYNTEKPKMSEIHPDTTEHTREMHHAMINHHLKPQYASRLKLMNLAPSQNRGAGGHYSASDGNTIYANGPKAHVHETGHSLQFLPESREKMKELEKRFPNGNDAYEHWANTFMDTAIQHDEEHGMREIGDYSDEPMAYHRGEGRDPELSKWMHGQFFKPLMDNRKKVRKAIADYVLSKAVDRNDTATIALRFDETKHPRLPKGAREGHLRGGEFIARPVAPPLLPPSAVMTPARSLAEKEQEIRRLSTHEHGYAQDALGRVLLDKKGLIDCVPLTLSELTRFARATGVVFTHNHPLTTARLARHDPFYGVSSFSPDDVEIACGCHLAEMRALTKRFTYSLKPGPSGWGDWEQEVSPMVHQVSEQVRSRLKPLVQAGLMKEAHAQALHWEEVWATIAPQLGWRYTRTEVLKP